MKDVGLIAGAMELHILAGMLVKMGKRDLEERLDRERLCVSGLSFGVLGLLSHGEHTISEIGRHMMISPPTLVPIVDSLEREGLVRRGQDPKDRRRTPILVTELGRHVLQTVPMVGESDSLVLAIEELGPERSQLLLDLLREVVAQMWQTAHPDQQFSIVDSVRDSVQEQVGILAGERERRNS